VSQRLVSTVPSGRRHRPSVTTRPTFRRFKSKGRFRRSSCGSTTQRISRLPDLRHCIVGRAVFSSDRLAAMQVRPMATSRTAWPPRRSPTSISVARCATSVAGYGAAYEVAEALGAAVRSTERTAAPVLPLTARGEAGRTASLPGDGSRTDEASTREVPHAARLCAGFGRCPARGAFGSAPAASLPPLDGFALGPAPQLNCETCRWSSAAMRERDRASFSV
jgi:hypothetical protein